MVPYLEIVSGRHAGRRFPLADAVEAVIGREESCEVPLFDEVASRRHATIVRADGVLRVRDLGSRNGTFLNGARVEGEARLKTGDELTVGGTTLRLAASDQRRVETRPSLQAADGFAIERAVRVEGGPAPSAEGPSERRLLALLALGRLIQRAERQDDLVAGALDALPGTVAADRAALCLAALPGQELDLAATRVHPRGAAPPSLTLLRRAYEGDEALLLSASEGPIGGESVVRQGVQAVMAAPIRAAGRRIGVLYVDRLTSGRRFEERDLAYLAEVARQLGAALAALLRADEAREEGEAWRRLATAPARDGPGSRDLVGESPPLREALALAARAAPSGLPCLLLGESGVGKELLARFVHERSDRAQGPFVPVNCAALPEGLLESELFGHERGAFTGADRRRRGLFELARGGTLFLDEVGELPEAIQAKLLRVLETKAVRRVGAEREAVVDFRLLAATNRDLEAEVRAGRFREDLFYRIAGVTLRLPPLRERPGDACLIAERLLERLARGYGRRGVRLSEGALAAIRGAAWPGNVRELKNAIERALVLCAGEEIQASDLGALRAGGAPDAEAAPISIAEAERRAIVRALAHTGGRKGEACELLGISHPTLNRKLKAYGIEG